MTCGSGKGGGGGYFAAHLPHFLKSALINVSQEMMTQSKDGSQEFHVIHLSTASDFPVCAMLNPASTSFNHMSGLILFLPLPFSPLLFSA